MDLKMISQISSLFEAYKDREEIICGLVNICHNLSCSGIL